MELSAFNCAASQESFAEMNFAAKLSGSRSACMRILSKRPSYSSCFPRAALSSPVKRNSSRSTRISSSLATSNRCIVSSGEALRTTPEKAPAPTARSVSMRCSIVLTKPARSCRTGVRACTSLIPLRTSSSFWTDCSKSIRLPLASRYFAHEPSGTVEEIAFAILSKPDWVSMARARNAEISEKSLSEIGLYPVASRHSRATVASTLSSCSAITASIAPCKEIDGSPRSISAIFCRPESALSPRADWSMSTNCPPIKSTASFSEVIFNNSMRSSLRLFNSAPFSGDNGPAACS